MNGGRTSRRILGLARARSNVRPAGRYRTRRAGGWTRRAETAGAAFTSLSLFLLTLHLADAIRRDTDGMNQAGLIAVVLVLVVWLYGILAMDDGRGAHAVMLAGGLLAAFVPVTHLRSVVEGELARSGGSLLEVWTLLVLSVTAIFTCVMAARGFSRTRLTPAERDLVRSRPPKRR